MTTSGIEGSRELYACLIVGGGPAALAPLVAASREGSLDALLGRGVAVVERTSSIGPGRIGSYAIWSDSTADSFLTVAKDHLDARLSALWDGALCGDLRTVGSGPISLVDAGRLQSEVGRVLHGAIRDAGGAVHTDHDALFATQTKHGWRTKVRSNATGEVTEIASRTLVLGTGGYQPRSHLLRERVAGAPLLPRFEGKVVQSGEVMTTGGLAAIEPLLAGRARPRVAIIGGSTSAVAAADHLLRAFPDRWQPGALTILHRRPLRVFFPSIAEARAEGYTEFSPDDVCPLTGFVYRLAGMRLRSRDLLMQVLGVGAPQSEQRVALHQLREDNEAASSAVLDDADLIVAAMGYRPRGFPLFASDGRPLPLLAWEPARRLVDDRCRVLGEDGTPIDGAYAIGLATGFELDASMGGEASFRGQANGLWLWQNHIGLRIAHAVLARARDLRAESGSRALGAAALGGMVPAFIEAALPL